MAETIKLRRLSEGEEDRLVETIYAMFVGMDENDVWGILDLLKDKVEHNLIVAPDKDGHRGGADDHS